MFGFVLHSWPRLFTHNTTWSIGARDQGCSSPTGNSKIHIQKAARVVGVIKTSEGEKQQGPCADSVFVQQTDEQPGLNIPPA